MPTIIQSLYRPSCWCVHVVNTESHPSPMDSLYILKCEGSMVILTCIDCVCLCGCRRSCVAGTCCFPQTTYSIRFLRFCKQVFCVCVYHALFVFYVYSRAWCMVFQPPPSLSLSLSLSVFSGHSPVLCGEACGCGTHNHHGSCRCIQRRPPQVGTLHTVVANELGLASCLNVPVFPSVC